MYLKLNKRAAEQKKNFMWYIYLSACVYVGFLHGRLMYTYYNMIRMFEHTHLLNFLLSLFSLLYLFHASNIVVIFIYLFFIFLIIFIPLFIWTSTHHTHEYCERKTVRSRQTDRERHTQRVNEKLLLIVIQKSKFMKYQSNTDFWIKK